MKNFRQNFFVFISFSAFPFLLPLGPASISSDPPQPISPPAHVDIHPLLCPLRPRVYKEEYILILTWIHPFILLSIFTAFFSKYMYISTNPETILFIGVIGCIVPGRHIGRAAPPPSGTLVCGARTVCNPFIPIHSMS